VLLEVAGVEEVCHSILTYHCEVPPGKLVR
jgi:hypothetical protein